MKTIKRSITSLEHVYQCGLPTQRAVSLRSGLMLVRLEPLGEEKRGQGQDDQNQAGPDGGVDVTLQDVVDEQRHGLSTALKTAREEDGRAEFAQCPRPTEGQPSQQRAQGQRQGDEAKQRPAGCAIDPRRAFNLSSDGLKADLSRADVKRGRNESLCQDDRAGGKSQADADACPAGGRADRAVRR